MAGQSCNEIAHMKLKNSSIVASCRRHSHVQSRVSRVQRGCLGLKRVGQVCSCLRILQAAKAISVSFATRKLAQTEPAAAQAQGAPAAARHTVGRSQTCHAAYGQTQRHTPLSHPLTGSSRLQWTSRQPTSSQTSATQTRAQGTIGTTLLGWLLLRESTWPSLCRPAPDNPRKLPAALWQSASTAVSCASTLT